LKVKNRGGVVKEEIKIHPPLITNTKSDMTKELMLENAKKYHGVRVKRDRTGRYIYRYRTTGEPRGVFRDPKEAAKAYDLNVIRENLDLPLNFFKKL